MPLLSTEQRVSDLLMRLQQMASHRPHRPLLSYGVWVFSNQQQQQQQLRRVNKQETSLWPVTRLESVESTEVQKAGGERRWSATQVMHIKCWLSAFGMYDSSLFHGENVSLRKRNKKRIAAIVLLIDTRPKISLPTPQSYSILCKYILHHIKSNPGHFQHHHVLVA